MKVFFMRCIDHAPFTPKAITILADSEKEAESIAKEKFGDGYIIENEQKLEKGVIDTQY
ncbi:hypothetical protein [Photobacterium kishitanii]|uniref:hypothetical protein n=1 Tax=Photobacterium kishitanii TaxID=318456 RepID=UPI0015E78D32|nr:hypothetical protein [Photobacterium kishitanii]